MEENQIFKRKMHPESIALRKVHKLRFTDEEYSRLQGAAMEWGFDKPRDFIVFLSEQKSLPEARDKNYSSRMRMKIKSLSSLVNMIDTGIEADSAKEMIVERVRRLCHEYK